MKYDQGEIRDIANEYEKFIKELKANNKNIDTDIIHDIELDLETILSELKCLYSMREENDELMYKESFKRSIAKMENYFIETMKIFENCKGA